ncbi:MAG: recombinase family protein [Solirubrobacterales bacterium]|nr:recombinase family protein [Solirubrobacterales bacterium]
MSATSIAHKVSAEQLARTAYLYVRQSTLRQVKDNTESAERQYALRQRAVQLGWSSEQIVVIDTDQGQSGASSADREGFQRLVADVGLGKAGIVLGLEVSRLARNNADWHRLLEICALSRTLICDEDGLYDPADFNDRLLLGLKGTMSEAELHFIRARLQGGILSKARRGELPMPLPVGLVGDSASRVMLDPDAGVQQAVRHLLDTFARMGSARAVVQAFNRDGLLFPARVRFGERKGELVWSPLTHWRVLRTLHNPRYAGAFAYGQRRTRKTAEGKTTTRAVPREEWTLIPDAHPGYITFEQYEHNLRTLAANATAHGTERTAGPAREGTALLQGLAVCGRCGQRMTVRYHTRKGVQVPDYQCVRVNIQTAGEKCQVVQGGGVDAAISQLLLDTVTPLALEVALNVQAELEARADEADQLRRSHIERARHRVELARRRYLAVDPDNRLVADTLEADWNDALRALQAAQDEYERQSAAANAALTEQHKQRIRRLASDFPKLWNDPATPARERKRITRLILEDVTLTKTDQVHLQVRLRGGQTTSLTIPKALNSWQARQTPREILAEIDRLLDDHTDRETAERLNQLGRRSGMKRPFTRAMIIKLRRTHDLPSHSERLRARGLLTQYQIAQQLGAHPNTIHAWRRAGLLHAHKANDKNDYLYEPPTPGDPRLRKRQGQRLSDREPAPSTPGGAV